MRTPQFWMVYGEDKGAPTHRHSSYASAEREAQRLARTNAGARFFVLAVCAGFVKSDVQEIEIGASFEEDIPF